MVSLLSPFPLESQTPAFPLTFRSCGPRAHLSTGWLGAEDVGWSLGASCLGRARAACGRWGLLGSLRVSFLIGNVEATTAPQPGPGWRGEDWACAVWRPGGGAAQSERRAGFCSAAAVAPVPGRVPAVSVSRCGGHGQLAVCAPLCAHRPSQKQF